MQMFHQFLVIALLALPTSLHAQLTYAFSGINAAIPDGVATGLVNVQQISDAAGLVVTDLNVTLNISGTGLGGFNGDLYVTLQHDRGYSVLLNRPGARAGVPYGYGDSGLAVILDDAATGDIHVYRQVLNGNDTTPLAGSLTGTWKPDARTADPASVLDSSPRTATLASFNGVSVNGTWTLFVTDMSTGATQQLDSWGLQITAVPEPKDYALFTGGALFVSALLRSLFKRTHLTVSTQRKPPPRQAIHCGCELEF
jgi:subtilisin-like proprotein convertase family protein